MLVDVVNHISGSIPIDQVFLTIAPYLYQIELRLRMLSHTPPPLRKSVTAYFHQIKQQQHKLYIKPILYPGACPYRISPYNTAPTTLPKGYPHLEFALSDTFFSPLCKRITGSEGRQIADKILEQTERITGQDMLSTLWWSKLKKPRRE